jgi:hypothetical protein
MFYDYRAEFSNALDKHVFLSQTALFWHGCARAVDPILKLKVAQP